MNKQIFDDIFFNYQNKIIILTINDITNYGNRLQNYALHYMLEKYAPNITLPISINVNNFRQKVANIFRNLVKKNIKKIYGVLFSNQKSLEFKRLMASEEFTRIYIPTSHRIVTSYNRSKLVEKAKLVVIGSDQVWNYRWLSSSDLSLRLGSFVNISVPIISYAASFGVSDIEEDAKEIFQKYLPRLKAISVREHRGAELIRIMTGLDAYVVLDPTLMLDSQQWHKITRGFVLDNERYVLTYFLGKPSKDQEITIQKFAKKHSCKVRRILDVRDEITYVAGPQDFVELFEKAEYVFTDSYHACCFSLLFKKQFTVFNRAGMSGKSSMNSRMETLFNFFGLDSVVINNGIAPLIDYEKVDKLLNQHRKESQTWLDKVMKEYLHGESA